MDQAVTLISGNSFSAGDIAVEVCEYANEVIKIFKIEYNIRD